MLSINIALLVISTVIYFGVAFVVARQLLLLQRETFARSLVSLAQDRIQKSLQGELEKGASLLQLIQGEYFQIANDEEFHDQSVLRDIEKKAFIIFNPRVNEYYDHIYVVDAKGRTIVHVAGGVAQSLREASRLRPHRKYLPDESNVHDGCETIVGENPLIRCFVSHRQFVGAGRPVSSYAVISLSPKFVQGIGDDVAAALSSYLAAHSSLREDISMVIRSGGHKILYSSGGLATNSYNAMMEKSEVCDRVAAASGLETCVGIRGEIFSGFRYYVMLLGSVLVVVGLGMAASYFLSRGISWPLLQLSQQMSSYLRNESQCDEQVNKSNEIDRLRIAFETMDGNITEYEREVRRNAYLTAIGRSAAMIAHDVRKPLSAITVSLGILARSQVHDQTGELVEALQQSVRKANEMLSDIMEFSRERVKLSRACVDVREVISETVAAVSQARRFDCIELEYRFNHDGKLDVDSRRIRRVFDNIVLNAWEALEGKGRLWFSTENARGAAGVSLGPGFISIAIGNDGPPIPPDFLETIFDPFVSQGKRDGTGLGLAIAKKIIESHGGRIEVFSDAVRTEFSIFLPTFASKTTG